MKLFILLTFSCFLSACASRGNLTLFLKETDQIISNLKDEKCLQSGVIIVSSSDNTHYRMITYYSNCQIKIDRRMRDFEPHQWLLPKKYNPHME